MIRHDRYKNYADVNESTGNKSTYNSPQNGKVDCELKREKDNESDCHG